MGLVVTRFPLASRHRAPHVFYALSPPVPAPANPALFLSYASQDAESARRICESLRAAGVEVWLDQEGGLVGGDAWDRKIREQIAACALFVPVVSAATQARREGYFRLEWKLAAQRTHRMSERTAFLLPVVIDGTRDADADVPAEFRAVQWTRLSGGTPTPQFVARVKTLLGGSGDDVGPVADRAPDQRPGLKPGQPRAKSPWLIPALLAVAAGVALVFWQPWKSKTPPASASVAVLAFTNLSEDKGNEYFSDGISEELLNVLAKVPGLKVSARTSAFHFKGKDTPIPEIARQLGVAYVVEGSVRKAGTQLRISARLLNATDGKQVWADDFREELKDVFALQDKIAGLIARSLQLTLGAATRKTRTVDPEAYRLLLEGRYFFNRRDTESFTRAEVAFTAALKIDPELAEAHSGLAGVYVIRANFGAIDGLLGFDATAPDLRRARLAAQRAIEIDSAQADAHAALGFALLLENRLTESEQELLKAIALNPNSALGHAWFAGVRYQQGRADLAAVENDRTSQLDPHLFINLIFYAQTLAQIDRYEDAWKVTERAAALRVDTYIPLRGEQARILLALGRNAEAAEVARDILRRPELAPRFWADSLALWVLRQTGFAAEAQGHTAALLARLPANSFQRGFIWGSVGRFDEALPFLEHTAVMVMQSLMFDQMWDPYRADPRFEQLMAKLGRAAEYKVARETVARLRSAPTANDGARRKPEGGGSSK